MLLPGILRRKNPNLKIGFFLHIPFPELDTFRILPEGKTILEGLLGADLIGFHIAEYAQHFLSACRYLLGELQEDDGNLDWKGRNVRLGAFPMGIDAQEWYTRARSEEAEEKLGELRDKYRGRKVVFSLDRLDYTKGMPQRLEAIAVFLERYPRWVDKVVFVQVAVPSRESIEEYQVIQSRVEQLAGSIVGCFGRDTLDYQHRQMDRVDLAAHYRLADVILGTSIKDGLCLIPKEGVATRDETDPVACIVSPFAGVSKEFEEALIINPWDRLGLVRGIRDALDMSMSKKKAMTTALRQRLLGNTNEMWAAKFLTQLDEVYASNH